MSELDYQEWLMVQGSSAWSCVWRRYAYILSDCRVSKLSSVAHVGVYFAKDGGVCISSYSRFRGETWAQSDLQVSACVALAEIVNLPELFRSFAPYFVVQQTDWIVW